MFNISFSRVIESTWLFIKSSWQLWATILGIGLILVFFEKFFDWLGKWLDERRVKKWLEEHKTLEEWKKVDDKEFERITAAIFEKLGYKTKVVGGPGDRGVDVIAEKEGKINYIQCKKMEKVSPHAIRDFYGAIVDKLKEVEKGFFVTIGGFTEEGKDFAEGKPIELIDGLKLEKLFKDSRLEEVKQK